VEKKSIKEKFKPIFKYFLISFGVLFLLRIGYGFAVSDVAAGQNHANGYFAGNVGNDGSQQNSVDNNLRKNYASEKKAGSATIQNKEKYEKVGSVASHSRDFVNDEKKLRVTVEQYKAVIQSEQATGLAGARVLRLGIGVDPEKFDTLIEDVRKIGELTDIQITKSDKTNEYKNLNAKRVSQEKYRTALNALKGRGGKVTELIELENKILEIEQEIQNLGVKLGEFDEQNEFCTVRFTLVENRGAVKAGFFTNLLRRIKIALEWTIRYYLMVALLLLFSGLGILVFLVIAEKLGFVKTLMQRLGEELPGPKTKPRKS
jgi:Domain of unknown function (DUF4349)